MAKTEFVYLKGKAKWVRHTSVNPWGKWAMTLYPDEASYDVIMKLKEEGLKNTMKKDEDGYNLSFSRPQNKTMKGKVVAFTPPEILTKEGVPLRDTLVGNGSDVTVKLAVYQHGTPGGGKAKAARWEALKVDNLVPFEMKRDFQEDQQKQVEGLMEQPEPIW